MAHDYTRAALAAQQIAADARIAEEEGWEQDKPHLGITEREEGSRDCAERIAAAIRNQPHDRTALDRIIADTRAEALRDAAKVCDKNEHVSGWVSRDAILAMIDKPIMSERARGDA